MFDDSHRVNSPTAASANATTAMTDAMSTTVLGCPPCTIASTTRPASTGVDTASSAPTTLIATNTPRRRWWRAENRQIRVSRARFASDAQVSALCAGLPVQRLPGSRFQTHVITVKPQQWIRSICSPACPRGVCAGLPAFGAATRARIAVRRASRDAHSSSGKMALMETGAPSPRVLVVDDDPDVLASLERGLRLSGFEVTTAVDGAEALRSATETRPDAIVLDINMPILDGVSVVTALRAMDNDVPVCVLSARSSVDDRVAGLEAGADDYLVKPFVLAELVARVKALLRRRGSTATFSSETIAVGPLEVDIPGRRARVNGADVDLTKREFDLLAVLAEHKTAVLSRAQLLELVWGYDFAADTNVVDVFIGYLRRKLEGGGAPRLLHTVRGVGFVLRQQ